MCRVTGSRHYSQGLPQGVEMPCILVFQGDSKYVCGQSKRTVIA